MTLSVEQITSNGLSMRVHRAVPDNPNGHTVVLLHGFPGLGYSWRHQWGPLADAGYQVLAPDMRGYGGTDCPPEVESYSRSQTVADVVGLLDAFDVEQAVFAGHDFGASLAWDLPAWAPDRVRALAQFSVPRYGASPVAPSTGYAHMAKDHWVHFHYFRTPGVAESELDPRAAEFLQRVFHALSANFHYLDVWSHPMTGEDGQELGYLDVLPDAPALPWAWLSRDEFDVYAAEFTRTGFRGGLNWYRAADLVWQENRDRNLADTTIECPVAFIAGERDSVVEMFGHAGLEAMRSTVTDLREIRLVPDAGHFVQMEAAEESTAFLLDFLAGLD